MILDAHAHIFRELRGTIAGGPVRAREYGRIAIGEEVVQMLPPLCKETTFPPDVLIAQMDWAGVDKAVLLQGSFYGDQNVEALDAARQYPDRLIAAAYFDPWAEDSQRKFYALLGGEESHRTSNAIARPDPNFGGFRALKLEMSEPTGFCGLRDGLSRPEARLADAHVAWLWDELAGRGLVLTLDLGKVGSRSYQTEAVGAIAKEHPELRIVIAHLGQITPAVQADPELLACWHEQIDLGRLPNVWFDFASLPAYLPEEDYPYPTAQQCVRLAIERIGPSKIMWGSDLPGLLAQATYPQLLGLGRLCTQFLAPEQQALILGGNALQVYLQCEENLG